MINNSNLKGFCVGVYLGVNQHITRMFTIAQNKADAIQNVVDYLDQFVTYDYKIINSYCFELKEGIVI